MIHLIFVAWIISSAWIAERLCDTRGEKVAAVIAIFLGPFACPVAWLLYLANEEKEKWLYNKWRGDVDKRKFVHITAEERKS